MFLYGKLPRGRLGRLWRGYRGRFRTGLGNRDGGRLFTAHRRCVLFFCLLRLSRKCDRPAGHTRLDGSLHLPQDYASTFGYRITQGENGAAGVEFADTLKILWCKIHIQIEAATCQQQKGQADRDGVTEAQANIVLVQLVKGAVVDSQHDIVLEVMPVLVREPNGQGNELLGEAVAAGRTERAFQPGRDGTLIRALVLPKYGVAAVLPALRVGHIKHVPQEYPAVAVTQQGDALGTGPDTAAHAVVPEVELSAGRGGGALGVDHDLIHKPVFVKLPRQDQEPVPIFDLRGQVLRSVICHLAVHLGFCGHLWHSLLNKK